MSEILYFCGPATDRGFYAGAHAEADPSISPRLRGVIRLFDGVEGGANMVRALILGACFTAIVHLEDGGSVEDALAVGCRPVADWAVLVVLTMRHAGASDYACDDPDDIVEEIADLAEDAVRLAIRLYNESA